MEQPSVSQYCPRCQVIQPAFQFIEDGTPLLRCQICGFPVETALTPTLQNAAEVERCETKILCVDDDPLIRQMLGDILRFHGYAVVSSPDGEIGLQAAQVERPDLILLDVMMPGLDGFEVCRRLKADPAMKSTPIIILTAMNDPLLNVKAFEAGAVLALQKTADAMTVHRTIEAALALRSRPVPFDKGSRSTTKKNEATPMQTCDGV
jgi:DNA-binding response OmpR family regulator